MKRGKIRRDKLHRYLYNVLTLLEVAAIVTLEPFLSECFPTSTAWNYAFQPVGHH